MTTTKTAVTPPTDCREMGLTPGVRYDRSRLSFAGWRNQAGSVAGDEVAGYCEEHYWDADGCYLGPDLDGIIPDYDFVADAE